MRIRRRPAILLSSTSPIETPDLLAENHELENNHPWRSEPADQQDLNTRDSESRLLHSVEDLELEANKSFPCFNPDQVSKEILYHFLMKIPPLLLFTPLVFSSFKSDQISLSSFIVSKKDLKESHSQNPSVNAAKSSGAPPSPANKRRRPALLMEGSRCSRVNGRGWRCSQPTLVGYSLCEHHLGKGRLRSMSSVKEKLENSSPAIESRKKAKEKIGVVKARSLSSLLGDDLAGNMTSPPQLPRNSDKEEY